MAGHQTHLNRVAMRMFDLVAQVIAAENRTGPGQRTYARSRDQFTPANINRNTGKPHEHKREIARRLRQSEGK